MSGAAEMQEGAFSMQARFSQYIVDHSYDPESILPLQYTSAAAQRYKLQLERDVAKSNAADAEESTSSDAKSAQTSEFVKSEPVTSTSTPAAGKLMGNGKVPSVTDLSDAGSAAGHGTAGTSAVPSPAGLLLD